MVICVKAVILATVPRAGSSRVIVCVRCIRTFQDKGIGRYGLQPESALVEPPPAAVDDYDVAIGAAG